MDINASDLARIKGVGIKTIEKLVNIGVYSIKDLVYTFPYKYVNRTKYISISDIKNVNDSNYYSVGIVTKIRLITTKSKKIIVSHYIEDNSGKINVLWFNFKKISDLINEGDHVVFSGIPNKSKLINPVLRKIYSEKDIDNFAIIEPVYPEINGFRLGKLIYKLVKQVFTNKLYIQDDFISSDNLSKLGLLEINSALKNIHLPSDENILNMAIKRLAFNEIYEIVKNAFETRKKITSLCSTPIKVNYLLHEKMIKSLPFNLTESQITTLEEIFKDLQKTVPMHRLLNGDVGSGKTVVAALAILQAINNNKQAVVLAPTTILAIQHYNYLIDFFNQFKDIKIHLVISGFKKNKVINNKKFLNMLWDENQKEIFVGTHALLYNTELLENVGLVVIDEQHKFGVKQREILEMIKSRIDGACPHVLSMSATPIPRSLALTIYGDLDISFLYKPSIRKKIITKFIANYEMEEKMYDWIRQKIKTEKVQAYMVCALIEESDKNILSSVTTKYDEIRIKFSDLNVGLLHGKLTQDEKNIVIENFINRKIDILVSTTVIEVGVNNPNANIVVIYSAERFGLAQLHQIRGRVGRSDKKGYCFVVTTNYTKLERIDYFCNVDDGFKIAEYDLKTRGPGELYGYEQSGLPNLKLANITDIDLVNMVRGYISSLN